MQNKILVLIDYSYFQYYTIFSAVNRFMKVAKLEAKSLIKPPEETDQSNLPNLLVSDAFKKELKKAFISKCELIDYIIGKNFLDEIHDADDVEVIAVQDDYLSKSFRKKIFPEYKSQRKLIKKSYNISAIQEYVQNIIIPDLKKSGKLNYKLLKVDNAEGDDVIACILKNFNDFKLRVLIASDHDFLQLTNVRQFDLTGKEIKSVIKIKNEEIEVDSKISLLMKIICGDKSDNIPAVAERIGKVKAYKLANSTEDLKKLLVENQDAAKQFLLNKKIIDFNEIPKELTEKILEKTNQVFAEFNATNIEQQFEDMLEANLMAL